MPVTSFADFTRLFVTTMAGVPKKEAIDNIFNPHVLFHKLKEKGSYKATGGSEIWVPLAPRTNSTVGWMTPQGTIDTAIQDPIEAGSWDWRILGGSIAILKQEFDLNSDSPHRLINLMDAYKKQAEGSMRESLVTALWAAAPGANDPDSIVTTVLNSGTIGGIDGAANTWWQSSVHNQGGGDAALSLDNIYNQIIAITYGTDGPDIALTTDALYGKLMNLLDANQRFEDSKLADSGFKNISVMGVPFVADKQAPAKSVYILNTDHIYLYYHPDWNFSISQEVEVPNQFVRVAKIAWMGNLVTDGRRYQSHMDSQI